MAASSRFLVVCRRRVSKLLLYASAGWHSGMDEYVIYVIFPRQKGHLGFSPAGQHNGASLIYRAHRAVGGIVRGSGGLKGPITAVAHLPES
jgi:hypothetical protein